MIRIPHFHGSGVGANLGTKILQAAWSRKRKIGRKRGRMKKEGRAEKNSAQGREAQEGQQQGQGTALGAKERLLGPDSVAAPGPLTLAPSFPAG